jgi:hypothetical protein
MLPGPTSAASEAPSARALSAYRLGDAILELDSDDGSVAAELRALFGECEVAGTAPSGAPRVRITLRSEPVRESSVSLELDASDPLDLVELVCSLLEPRPGVNCTVSERPEGWSLISLADAREPQVAVAPNRAVVRTAGLRPSFFRDFAASAALRVQRDVLILHGASLGVGGAGVLLAGRGGAGKTTLALTLASRGHTLLGDDMAALRVPTLELLPFRRTIHIRRGVRAASVERALQERHVAMETLANSTPRAHVQPRELFPSGEAASAPLRAAFFLRAFRKTAALERFTPALSQLAPLRPLAVRLQWGIAPARRMVRFAQAAQCLARVPCYFLDVARPEDTAALIEEILEER